MAKPLWVAMCNAYLGASSFGATVETDQAAWAAEIRAVADWIRAARQDYDEALHGAIRGDEMDTICALLTAEADHAERGEGG